MLVEEIVDLAENLTAIALIGLGGIGNTSIALTVLHYDRIKQRFGDNRWFIRCDQFPSSCVLDTRTGDFRYTAEQTNPKSLTSLRPFLSLGETHIVPDHAESILDPQGIGAKKIYAVLEELSQLKSVCLCITSRISTVPLDREILEVLTLPIYAMRDMFYCIYKNAGQPELVDNILNELDFHPLPSLCSRLLDTRTSGV